jgi:LDH2 family malate/lactate/ureidoglycolate dehydrogenase
MYTVVTAQHTWGHVRARMRTRSVVTCHIQQTTALVLLSACSHTSILKYYIGTMHVCAGCLLRGGSHKGLL